ncbi:uncharacterized protein [Periplaneta americana]|uniref:uncharacterized protein isoform X2 n=1 Tax=Periplaneta americana TaxID=6978 RepID=UPI0037E7842B
MNMEIHKQDLLKLIKFGDLRTVISDVQVLLKNENQGKMALSLLSGVSSTITSNGSTEHLKPGDVFQLCYMCCTAIEVENLTTDKYKFLCSVYHVVKYIINEDLESALKLSNFVSLTSCKVDEDSCSIYYNYFYLFHRIVIEKKNSYLQHKDDLSSALTIFKESVNFLKCCIGSYLLQTLDRATNFLYGVKLESDESLLVVQVQIDILNLTYCKDVDKSNKISEVQIFKSYVCLLSSILKNLFDAGSQLQRGECVVNKIADCIGMWNKTDAVSEKCVKLLQKTLVLMLKRPSDFVNGLKMCTQVLNTLILRYGDSEILNWTSITIMNAMLQVSSYWNSETAEEWNKHMTVDVQYGLSVFISHLSEKLLTTNCIKCTLPSGEECAVQNDMISSINLLGIVINLAVTSVVNKTEGFPKLVREAVVTLEKIIAQLKTLKAGNCPAWRNMWKVYGIKAYNLGFHCNSAGLLHEAKEVFSQFCWTCIQLEEEPTFPEVGKGLLGVGMQYLVQLYRDLKKYRHALRIIAVALKMLPDLKDRFLRQWVKIKKHTNVQSLTVCDILQEDEAKIQIWAPNVNLEEVNCPQLLLWELEAYSQQSVSDWECVRSVYNKLNCIPTLNRILRAQGLLAYVPSVWIHGSVEDCKDIGHSIKSMIEVFEKEIDGSEKESVRLFYIGNLYYWFFLCQVRVMRSKQEEEILQSNIIPTKIEDEQEDNPDPLQTCNVIPAYANLNLENESRLLENLNKAVGAWILSLVNGLDADDGVKSLPNIEVAAYMYELYGYDTLKLRTWCLYFKYAEVLNNKEAMLLALCRILEWCTCGVSECKWLTKAEELIVTLRFENNKEYNSQLLFHKYLLARCRHCYRNEQFTEIEEYLKRLIEYTKQEELEHFSQSVLHVRVRLLIAQCMLLPRPHTITLPNRKSAFNEAILTYSSALYLLKQMRMTPAENTEVLSLLLEISQWLGRLNLYLFWPREARCFMKGDLVLSQKLGLTTRTAQFLNLLAQVDIMCCNVDDCQVKLTGIEFLLQLKCGYQQYNAAKDVQESAIYKELSSRLKQLTLDSMKLNQLRDSSIRNRCSPCGSPNLRKSEFVLPEFVNHESDCKCAMCNIPALQTLVLDITYIQAQLYRNQSELERALEFFEGGIRLYQQLLDLQKEVINKLMYEVEELTLDQGDNKDYLSLFLHPLKIGYIHVTKSYADFLGASSSYDLALKLNSEALQEVQKLKIMYPHLVVDVMNQTLCIKHAQVLGPATKKKDEDQCASHISSTNLQLADQFAKTPLNPCSSEVRIFPVPSSTYNSNEDDDRPVIRKPRKLFLPGGEDEIEEKENKEESVQKKIRVSKRNQSKQVTIYEDSPVTNEKTEARKSNMKERKSVRTARKKASPLTHRNLRSKRTVTERESLSKVCQAFEFTIDSPVRKTLSSNRKTKQKSCSKNTKSMNKNESDLDTFFSDKIFCTETVTSGSKQ